MRTILPLVLLLLGCPGPDDAGPAGDDPNHGHDDDDDDTATDDDDTVTDDDDDDTQPGDGSHRVIGYFPAWGVYGRDYHVPDIPAEHLTHVLYAFANVSAAGECELGDPYADIDKFYPGDTWDAGALRGSFHQLQLLKQAHPHLRTLLSVGGWTWSGRFSDAALTDGSRERLASSCVRMIQEYDFDGLSIDWEYPVEGGLEGNTTRPEDGANHRLLMQALRDELDRAGLDDGAEYELSMAASANPAYVAHLDVEALDGLVDWFDVMAYDFRGSWSSLTGLQSPLFEAPGDPADGATVFNGAAAVEAYLARGVDPSRIVLGLPFYGRGWAGVPDVDDGLFQPFSGLPTGTWEAGVFDYSDLAENWITPATAHYEPSAEAPWIHDAELGVMITYEDPTSVGRKAQYVKDRDLGGIMFWELSSDTDDDELLTAITDVLGRPGP
jgi:chitinase